MDLRRISGVVANGFGVAAIEMGKSGSCQSGEMGGKVEDLQIAIDTLTGSRGAKVGHEVK